MGSLLPAQVSADALWRSGEVSLAVFFFGLSARVRFFSIPLETRHGTFFA
ncbi:hypothetical protein [Nitrosococcus wardiae]|nr:hypothetical protein [Nitrosococcus wardiae]